MFGEAKTVVYGLEIAGSTLQCDAANAVSISILTAFPESWADAATKARASRTTGPIALPPRDGGPAFLLHFPHKNYPFHAFLSKSGDEIWVINENGTPERDIHAIANGAHDGGPSGLAGRSMSACLRHRNGRRRWCIRRRIRCRKIDVKRHAAKPRRPDNQRRYCCVANGEWPLVGSSWPPKHSPYQRCPTRSRL